MSKTDGEAALFAVRCLVAAVLAFYVAALLGLSRPYWAVTTSFIVAQPLSGAVFAKAVYRLVGTVTGAGAAVLLIPSFVNQPLLLSAAMALWLGLCVYLALLDRTARAYLFLLAGFTASIIGFPTVDTPGLIFNVAAERVQEISIGILAGSVVHGALLPRTVSDRLRARVDAIVEDAQRWAFRAIHGTTAAVRRQDEARLAADLSELDALSINLPFDTARIVPSRRDVRDLQDQLALLLPLVLTVMDRLHELRHTKHGLPGPVADLVTDVGAWLIAPAEADDSAAAGLAGRARQLQSEPTNEPIWREMLILSLLGRLEALVSAIADCRRLRDRIKTPNWRNGLVEVLLGDRGRQYHLDQGVALRAAAGTVTSILLSCIFWRQTAWPDGGQATLMVGVCCALFGNVDRPASAVMRFLTGFAVGLVASTVYAFVLIPRTTDLVALSAILAPAFLLLGSMLAKPPIARFSAGALVAFPNTVGLYLTYNPDFHGFINIALAQLVGVGFATVMLWFYQAIDHPRALARVRRASFRDIAQRADGRLEADDRWLGRMLDRLGLLITGLRPLGGNPEIMAHAVKSLRIGWVSGELRLLGAGSSAEERDRLSQVLRGIGDHFRGLDPRRLHKPSPALLHQIDSLITAFAADPVPERRRRGLTLLTGLRRNLFAEAAPYRPGRSA